MSFANWKINHDINWGFFSLHAFDWYSLLLGWEILTSVPSTLHSIHGSALGIIDDDVSFFWLVHFHATSAPCINLASFLHAFFFSPLNSLSTCLVHFLVLFLFPSWSSSTSTYHSRWFLRHPSQISIEKSNWFQISFFSSESRSSTLWCKPEKEDVLIWWYLAYKCMSLVPFPNPLPHAATSALSSSPIFLPPHIRLSVWFLREPASQNKYGTNLANKLWIIETEFFAKNWPNVFFSSAKEGSIFSHSSAISPPSLLQNILCIFPAKWGWKCEEEIDVEKQREERRQW